MVVVGEKSFTLLVKSNDYCTGKDSCDELEKEEESATQKSEEEESNSGNGNGNEENPLEPEEDPKESKDNTNKKED